MNETRCVRCGDDLQAGYDPRRPCPRCLFELALDDPEGSDVVYTKGGDAPAPAPAPADLAADFPQLEILELLGEGGMGIVYRARQRDLDRHVALKILRPHGAEDGSFAERFMREARALAKLSHPGIVSVHDFGKAGDHYFLMMELVEGTNLRRLIRGGELAAKQALDVVSQVCAALQFAHDQGVVHRDIKPENILVDPQGRVKIADFGLAKMARAASGEEYTSRLTQASQRMGTPQYMAPEQIEHPLDVDHRADIYSLGVVFYELLTGELPLGRFAPPSRKVQVDVRLDEVVLKTLEKEPERRYQHASEVGTRIENIQNEEPPRRKTMASHHHREHEHGRREGRSAAFWIFATVGILVGFTCLGLGGLAAAALLFGATSYEAQPAPIQAEVGPRPEEPPAEGLGPFYEDRAREGLVIPDAAETVEDPVPTEPESGGSPPDGERNGI